MLRKVLYIYGLVVTMNFMSACCGGGSDTHFIDFDQIVVTEYNTTVNSADRYTYHDDLLFSFTIEDFYFISQSNSFAIPNFTTEAIACSPLLDGDRGIKNKVSRIEIYSDKSFDPLISTFTTINKHFYFRNTAYQNGELYLDKVDLKNSSQQINAGVEYNIYSKYIPPELGDYTFTIKLIRNNGEVVETTTKTITYTE